MRCTLNIPCLWQLGVIPRFDGYACQVALPLLVFLVICGFISFNIHRQSTIHDEPSFTDSSMVNKIRAATSSIDIKDSSLHYGVMIDCGSSGSRVYVYVWPPHTGLRDQLLRIQPMKDPNGKPYVKKIEPGISAFVDNPSQAAEYLRPLLDYAAEAVPRDKHQETPLYVLSTAGMRLLSESDQEVIMSDIKVDVPLWYDFLFMETHAEVISGKQEAIYAWVSINYALGRFDHSEGVSTKEHLSLVELPGPDPTTHVRKQTVGILDMGGGSLQVAFEVPQTETAAKGLITEFSLGCTRDDVEHMYRLYTTTFLNYGSNTARKLYEQTLLANVTSGAITAANGSHSESHFAYDPCLPVKFREQISQPGEQILTLEGTGDYHECIKKLRPLLNQTVTCAKEPCSLNGIYQPEIDFEHSQFYGFSEFYYTMEDLLLIGGQYNYRKFQSFSRDFCTKEWPLLEEWHRDNRYPRADQNRYRLQCFKSVWLALVLHEGLKFPTNYKHLTSVQYIDSEEVHWTLGALLYKTKYYPLRELDKHETHHYQPPWMLTSHTNYLIIVCIIIVLAAILVHTQRLRPWRTPEIRRVPTMSYFMTDEGQVQEGLLSIDGYSSPERYYQYS